MRTTLEARLPLGQILIGDVRTRLLELPSASVDTVITSPPYFALRDYGHRHQLGQEPNIREWVANLVGVCDELARVLKPGGSLWLNVADQLSAHRREGAAKKSLLLGPERLAIALEEHGWIIRNKIIWAKSNPMPSSVRDRLSCSHEVIFLLVRSPKYFFDLDVIRQPLLSTAKKQPQASDYQYLPDELFPAGAQVDDNRGLNRLKVQGLAGHPLGKNPGDVWQLSTSGYRGAHFATFPLALVERSLLASCPAKVCAACGAPWTRESVDRQQEPPRLGALHAGCRCGGATSPGVVLDPFIGSGTVALATELHGRQWIGIELNPTYAALAEQRIAHERRHRGRR